MLGSRCFHDRRPTTRAPRGCGSQPLPDSTARDAPAFLWYERSDWRRATTTVRDRVWPDWPTLRRTPTQADQPVVARVITAEAGRPPSASAQLRASCARSGSAPPGRPVTNADTRESRRRVLGLTRLTSGTGGRTERTCNVGPTWRPRWHRSGAPREPIGFHLLACVVRVRTGAQPLEKR